MKKRSDHLHPRRTAREHALQTLYAREFGREPGGQEDTLLQVSEPVCHVPFYNELIALNGEHLPELDASIKSKALNWDFSRLALLDKLILRLALCEFLYCEDIPPKVTIDEWLEVAKKFSTAKSSRFINGILDALLTEYRKKNLLHKTGRGLIEEVE